MELKRRGLDAHAISQFDEKDYTRCFTSTSWPTSRRPLASPQTRPKAEISLQAMTRVHMQDSSGPGGGEKLIADYRHAYHLELRAKLVEDSSIATTTRLYEMRQKMSPEFGSFIKGSPDDIQPTNLESMYDAIRQWADKERAGQPNHDGHEGGRRRRERHNELKVTQPSASTGTASTSTTSTQGGAAHEAIQNMMTSGIAQALAKVGAKGKGKGDPGGKGAPVTLQRCSRCKGMHLPKLALESCPNKVSLEAGTLKGTLSEGKV